MTISNWLRTCHELWSALAVMIVALSSTGCTMVGPDYVRPPAPTATDWIETSEPAVKRESTEVSVWWTVFHDPVLNTLVETAYRRNPSLRAAGVRVLEAQAQRGIALGQLFPQQQEAARAVELADFQYREGAVDYTRVLNSQQFLVEEQDRLVTTEGAVAVNLVSLYRALGGGWESRAGKDFVSDTSKAQMRERTNWGAMLSTEGQAEDIGAATSGTEGDQRWWRWRWWWPKW